MAKAIARVREEAKPEKAAEPGRVPNDASKPHLAHLAKSIGPRQKAGGPAVTPSTKRPKMGGGG